MSIKTGEQADFAFVDLHGMVLDATNQGGAPLLLIRGQAEVQIDALEADPERQCPAAIRVATLAMIGNTASLTVIMPDGRDGEPLVTKGSHGRVFREPGDDAPLTAYLAGTTPMATVGRKGARAILEQVTEDINAALSTPNR